MQASAVQASPFTAEAMKETTQKAPVTVHAVATSLANRAHSLPAQTAQPREKSAHHGHHRGRPTVDPATATAASYTQHIELYRGSVSTVYRAVDEATGARVILKCYHKNKMQEKHYHKLDREIMAMQALKGPYVAELYGWFQDTEAIWLVMEWCEGGDLFKCMMLHGGRLDEFYVCVEIIAPLLRVLEKSHAQNIMHRDIKPENIFLTKANRLRLGDFGLAVKWTEELPFSRSGTLDYMAPEVLRNPATTMQENVKVQMPSLDQRNIKPYTEKVDVWAVGILAYELVVGKPPFEVEDEAQTASLIMYSNTIRFPAGHSPLWADFVQSVLIKDPAQRPSAAKAMEHPWIRHHIQSALQKAKLQNRVSSKEALLRPLSLPREPIMAVNTLAAATAATTPTAADAARTTGQADVLPTPAPAPAALPATPASRTQPGALPPASPVPRTPQPHGLGHHHHHHAHPLAHSYTQPLRSGLMSVSGSSPAMSDGMTPYSPTVDRPAARCDMLPGQPTSSADLTAAASSFAQVSAALAAAAGEGESMTSIGGLSVTSSGSLTAQVSAALQTQRSYPFLGQHGVTGGATNSVTSASTQQPHWLPRPASQTTGMRGASPLSRPSGSARGDSGSSGRAAAAAAAAGAQGASTPRAHACVAVTRSGSAGKQVDAAGNIVDLGRPPSQSLRAAVPHLQKHLAAIRLPTGDDGSVGNPASPGPMALPSPAPTAGHKNRSLLHLKNQAWA